MRQRTLVIAGLVTVGMAIAIAVPMAILAIQDLHALRFEYVKSGGIAGITNRITFDSANSTIISFHRSAINATEERRLSDSQVQELRQTIAGSGFFTFDSIYPPRKGPADYFSHTLNITMDGRTHSVSWVDDFAAAEPVPEGLKSLVSKIEQTFSSAPPI